MSGTVESSAAYERAATACRHAAERLATGDVATEALAEYVPPRKRLLGTKKATMRPLGEVWRLGTILLATDGALFALGGLTRAEERGRPGYQSLSREARREIAAAALRGGYAAGTPVNFDATPILHSVTSSGTEPEPLDDARSAPPQSSSPDASANAELPVGLHDGELRVRWRAGAPLTGAPTLASYLEERVGLLLHPPLGAGD